MKCETKVSETRRALCRGVLLTGSLAALSRHTGISRTVLRNIANNEHNPTTGTRLRLQAFVEEQESRAGRPFKTTSKKGNTNV